MDDQYKRQWFLRVPTDIVRDEAIMTSATRHDWKAYLAIAMHQGYRSRSCRLSLARIAKVAHVSRYTASHSIRFWRDHGALLVRRTGKFNTFEIPQTLQPPSDKVVHPRTISREAQKRDRKGKFAPCTVHRSCPSRANRSCPSTVHTTKSLSSEVFNKIPPPPPAGGNGLRSETSSDHHTPPPISEETLKEIQKVKGRVWLVAHMKDRGYPLSWLPKEEEKPSPSEEKNGTADRNERQEKKT